MTGYTQMMRALSVAGAIMITSAAHAYDFPEVPSAPQSREAAEATEDEKKPDYSENLTGSWQGKRAELDERGISAEITYKADVISNLDGGKKEGTRGLDNLDIILHADGEKLVGAKGLSATVHLLNNFGSRPDNDLVGSNQGIDNIEVPRATAKLYQAFLQQNLFDDKISLLAGLYDLNSEFYVTPSSGLFLHSTFGIGTEIAATGQNGPSIFPYTSVGGRVRVNPTKEVYMQAVVLDGVPGDPNHLKGTHINFDKNDGELVVGEMGYTPEGAKIGVGGWYYTEKFPDQLRTNSNGDPLQEQSNGFYIIGEKRLYEEAKDQRLSTFARLGFANGDVSQFDYAWSAGLVYTGLIPGRDEGQLGLGVTNAHNSDAFRSAAVLSGAPMDKAETTVELTYSDKLTPWLSIQPDLQYIINPGTDPALDNAFVVGARVTVKF